jgi:hypothetical protein
MKLGPDDRLTVLDDSCNEAFLVGRRLLSSLPIAPDLSHWATCELFSALKIQLPAEALEWIRRRADRDIAPLRNLSLLISVCYSSESTVLVDDDITEFDLDLTRQAVAQILHEHGVALAGAHITGTDEEGVIDRLARAVGALEIRGGQPEPTEDVRTFFHTSAPKLPRSFESVDYVSGGYLAFCLPTESLVAFPPGYNEDWLWCLEIVRHGIAKVFRLPELVTHDPPCIRNMTREDVHFELLGDLVFGLAMPSRTPPLAVGTSSHVQPSTASFPFNISHDILPTTRVRDLVERSRLCSGSHRLVDAGLGLLERMLSNRSLAIDWRSEVVHWQKDAEKKRRSFALALNAHKGELQHLFHRKEALI